PTDSSRPSWASDGLRDHLVRFRRAPIEEARPERSSTNLRESRRHAREPAPVCPEARELALLSAAGRGLPRHRRHPGGVPPRPRLESWPQGIALLMSTRAPGGLALKSYPGRFSETGTVARLVARRLSLACLATRLTRRG